MSAKVSTSFKKRFELNEENIRRIHSDIRKRTPDDNHHNIIFEVFREDSLVFRTSEVDRLLSESNDSTQKIKELNIEYQDDNLNILLEFDAEKGAELTINGEDRDQVFLISSDLKEYIQKEVCHINSGVQDKRLIIVPIAICAALLVLLAQTINPIQESINIEQAMSSSDTNLKLNYLISLTEKKNTADHKGQLLSLVPFLLMLFIFIPAQKIYNYFSPGNIFLIGKQISIVSQRRSFVRSFFWGGLVALIIAFGSGYYFLWLSK
ncbi:hypothetical protein [Streptomyces sp. NPDC093594]|uniref:hypothetical protein n=1 Tax=Streptomyces sp. NPDC093594 TaxID=3155305 RepID=UPI00344D44F6